MAANIPHDNQEIEPEHQGILAQMALAWCLKDQKVCSVIIGASRVEQIADNLKAIENTSFSPEELDAITACVL